MIDLEVINIEQWYKDNIPDPNLYYKEYLTAQIKELLALQKYSFINKIGVCESHTSKSVTLPVTYLNSRCKGKEFCAIIRDNFYDIKCVIDCNFDIDLDYKSIHIECSEQELLKQKNKAFDYNVNPNNIKYFKDDSWYHKCWSSGKIIRDGDNIYMSESVDSVYCEGIHRLPVPEHFFIPYEKYLKSFTMSTSNYSKLTTILLEIYKQMVKSTK